MPTIRAFVAIELTPEILEALSKVQGDLQKGEGGRAGRWVKQEGIHLTLKFLGEVPQEKLLAIQDALARACMRFSPFTVKVGGLGCFPNMRRPRVVWVGVQEDAGELVDLQKAVEREISPLGFPTEARGFTPHLTLARVRDDVSFREVEMLGKAVADSKTGELAEMQVRTVSLMKSDLKPGGAVYTELFQAPLTS
jgi:RNA 2',3'-cyclic 3'-phosphodiesterase